MKNPFEHYLTFIEHELGTPLLDWQKTILRNEYEGKHYCYNFGRITGKHVLYQSALMLKSEMARDSGCLLPWLYKPDGYTTDVVIYDELEKEN